MAVKPQVHNLPLGDQLRKIAAKQMADAERVVRASLIETGQNIIAGTPVDKGRARNSWNTAIGTPDTTVRLDTSTSGRMRCKTWKAWRLYLRLGKSCFLPAI